MNKLLLICFILIACKVPKTNEEKKKEFDSLFHISMLRDTYFFYDSVRAFRNDSTSPFLKLEYVYDSISGVKQIEERQISGNSEIYFGNFFLNGKIFKLYFENIPLSVPAGTKYQSPKALYYVDGRTVFYKWERDARIVDIPKQIRITDSLAEEFNKKLNIK